MGRALAAAATGRFILRSSAYGRAAAAARAASARAAASRTRPGTHSPGGTSIGGTARSGETGLCQAGRSTKRKSTLGLRPYDGAALACSSRCL